MDSGSLSPTEMVAEILVGLKEREWRRVAKARLDVVAREMSFVKVKVEVKAAADMFFPGGRVCTTVMLTEEMMFFVYDVDVGGC